MIKDVLKDANKPGYIPYDLIDRDCENLFANPLLELSLTALTRPFAIFVKVISMLQEIVSQSGSTKDEIWILQEGPTDHKGISFRKCFVFLAVTYALKSLLNSRIAELDPDT
jgi:hypothetical protein